VRHLSRQLLTAMLMPVFLVAQLLCICSGNMVAAAEVSPHQHAASTSEHNDSGCHDNDIDDAGHSDHESGEHSHKHDSSCPHCSGQVATVSSSERLLAQDAAFSLSPFAFALSTLVDFRPLDASSRFQAFMAWLSDPSPPPDLLRVKCTLQV
jgi:hypothetical protein